jgi:hypothetical protein
MRGAFLISVPDGFDFTGPLRAARRRLGRARRFRPSVVEPASLMLGYVGVWNATTWCRPVSDLSSDLARGSLGRALQPIAVVRH